MLVEMTVVGIVVVCFTAAGLQYQWLRHLTALRKDQQQTDAEKTELKELKAKVDALVLRAGFIR